MSQYGRLEYWEERYTLEHEPFEWYQRYPAIRHFFTNDYLSETPSEFPPRSEQRVLVIGCGNSQLSEEMREDGFGYVTSVDFSHRVIEQMRDKYPNSTYEVMDVTKQFSFSDNSFDIIVCKGTMDAILCGAGSLYNIRNTMIECSRVLGDHGALVIITYGAPADRMVYIEDEAFGWTVDVHTVSKPRIGFEVDPKTSKDHYVYVCKKGSNPSLKSEELHESQQNSGASGATHATDGAEGP